MTTATDESLTREETRALHRLASKLEREAETAKLGGLEDRAATLKGEADTIRERIRKATEARQDERLEDLRERNRQEERHKEAERRREEEETRQAAALEWFRSFAHHGPVEAVQALREAGDAGHAASDLLAVTLRVKRRRDGAGCLALPGTYFRRDYTPLREL